MGRGVFECAKASFVSLEAGFPLLHAKDDSDRIMKLRGVI